MMNKSLALSVDALFIVALELNKMACLATFCMVSLVLANKKKPSAAINVSENAMNNSCFVKEETANRKTIWKAKEINKNTSVSGSPSNSLF